MPSGPSSSACSCSASFLRAEHSCLHKQSLFYSLVYCLSPPLDWNLPEGRGRLRPAALRTQCTQEAFSGRVINERGLCDLSPGSLIFSGQAAQPCSKPRGWQGRLCRSGGLWDLTREANMPETLLRMQGWQQRSQPRGSGAERRLSDTCGEVPAGVSGLSPQRHLQEGNRVHSAGDRLERGRCTLRAHITRWVRKQVG